MSLPIFAITLFISAFLLFFVQPMIGKMLLPNLGGTPQVWNTCMVFFQGALLAGYGYTHFVSTKLKLRTQLIAHGILLLLPLAILLTGSFRDRTQSWIPVYGSLTVFDTLFKLTLVVGLPFFVVSTSAPLLQRWFAHTDHPAGKDPYFLYGASNFGSLLSLLAFPFFVERTFLLSEQSWMWAGGYIVLIVAYFVCVSFVWKAPPLAKLPGSEAKPEKAEEEKAEAKPEESEADEEKETSIAEGTPKKSSVSSKIRKGSKQRRKKSSTSGIARKREDRPIKRPVSVAYEEVRSDVMTPWRRLRWVLLGFVPSSMMLGVITYISTDVSAIPLFWVIPLALYLVTFILVFLPKIGNFSWTKEPHTLLVLMQPVVVAFFIYIFVTGQVSPIHRSVIASILAFFITALVCHGELARDRPSPKHLTEFFLLLAIGGFAGGFFNAIMAPVLFWGLAEVSIVIIVAYLLRPATAKLAPVDKIIAIISCGALGLVFGFILSGGLGWVIGTIQGLSNLSVNWVLGTFVGGIVGLIIGVLFNRDPNGWTETSLISLIPDLGKWADEKGKEMLQEAGAGEKAAEPEGKKKKSLRSAEPPNYFVLNYATDISLALVVVIYLLFVYSVTPDPNSRDPILNSFLFKMFDKTFGFETKSAFDLARNSIIAFRLLIPVFFLCGVLFAARPLRCGLAIAAVFLFMFISESNSSRGEILARTRSYFGILRVLQETQHPVQPSEAIHVGASQGNETPYTYLMHGTTHHGLNFQSPQGMRRLATTYYHRKGPVGVIMERFNWFPGPQNTYKADVRMPAALAGMGAGPLNFGCIPDVQLVNLWSEPPYCCIGLGTGTMASYCRPLQHMTFYEIDEKIRQFSLGEFELPAKLFLGDSKTAQNRRGPYFNYIHDAIQRGGNVEIYMGDARISMKPLTEDVREKDRKNGVYKNWKKLREGIACQHREHYYHAMEIDAFSSDAIPVHLITIEGIQQYLDKLAPEGIILVHTSNRHVDLVPPVVDIAQKLGLRYRVVNCQGLGQARPKDNKLIGSGSRGHFQSEYVMLGRSFEKIAELTGRPVEEIEKAAKKRWNDRVAELLGVLPKEITLDAGALAKIKRERNMDEEMANEMMKVWFRDTVLPNATHEHTIVDEGYIYQRYIDRTTGEPFPYVGYQVWTVPPPAGNRIWTDDFSDLMSVFRWGWGH